MPPDCSMLGRPFDGDISTPCFIDNHAVFWHRSGDNYNIIMMNLLSLKKDCVVSIHSVNTLWPRKVVTVANCIVYSYDSLNTLHYGVIVKEADGEYRCIARYSAENALYPSIWASRNCVYIRPDKNILLRYDLRTDEPPKKIPWIPQFDGILYMADDLFYTDGGLFSFDTLQRVQTTNPRIAYAGDGTPIIENLFSGANTRYRSPSIVFPHLRGDKVLQDKIISHYKVINGRVVYFNYDTQFYYIPTSGICVFPAGNASETLRYASALQPQHDGRTPAKIHLFCIQGRRRQERTLVVLGATRLPGYSNGVVIGLNVMYLPPEMGAGIAKFL